MNHKTCMYQVQIRMWTERSSWCAITTTTKKRVQWGMKNWEQKTTGAVGHSVWGGGSGGWGGGDGEDWGTIKGLFSMGCSWWAGSLDGMVQTGGEPYPLHPPPLSLSPTTPAHLQDGWSTRSHLPGPFLSRQIQSCITGHRLGQQAKSNNGIKRAKIKKTRRWWWWGGGLKKSNVLISVSAFIQAGLQ